MANEIIINKRYFDNIEKAVTSLNEFFSSNFKNKNFVNIDEDTDLDEGVRHCMSIMNDVDPTWITDPENANEAVDKINAIKPELTNYAMNNPEGNFFTYCSETNNTALSDIGYEYLSFKALQQVSDNFSEFEKLMNGLYSFDLFLHPSAYKNAIAKFSETVPTGECSDVLANVSFPVFDSKAYISSLFENEDIQFPAGMDYKSELERFDSFQDLDNITVRVDEAIQEAAEVNFFENTKPKHIKYSNGKWVISDQFKKTVNELVAALRKCDTTDDLKTFFENESKKYAKDLNDTVAPFILVQAMIKKGKEVGGFTKHSDSYASIISKNSGAKRFENYDIFTTFKSDKTGTIKFLDDFFNLRLVNDDKAYVANNTILTLFNIFDSRIYYDILYNLIPDKEKKDKNMDEDSFVKQHRAIINKNSRGMNTYATDTAQVRSDNTEKSSKEIKEYAYNTIRSMGDMDISDMVTCEAWVDMIREEIESVDDGLYNAGIPSSATAEYIGESFNDVDSIMNQMIMESVEEHNKVTAKTVMSGLIGGVGGTAAAFIVGAGTTTMLSILIAIGITSPTLSIIGNKLAKKRRGKNIKAEILRDIDAIVRILAKDVSELDGYLIKELRKRAKVLVESTSFAMKSKDTFKDVEREYLMDLHHAATRMSKIQMGDTGANENIIKSFFKAADEVTKMITKITDEEILAALPDQNIGDVSEEETTETSTVEDDGEVEETVEEKTESDEKDDSESSDDDDDDDDVKQEGFVQEVDHGGIPEYMKTRIALSDEDGSGKKTTVTDVNPPAADDDTPSNSIDDLSASIDAKISAGGDNINDMIGKEAKKEGNHIVYNVTNNYNYSNSFNKTSTDLSSGKVTDQSISVNKSKDPKNTGSNNINNSTTSSDPTDKKNVQEFSTGYSVDDVFSFLESGEPLLEAAGSNKPPKEDSLTRAMDRDRKALPKQQAAKKAVDKTVSTAKAATKPIIRTKHWLLGIVDSLVKRKEDKVKAEIIESPSYRTALFKASRIAIKAGLFGVALTINGYLAGVYAVVLASNAYDKQRLRKEVQAEFATEMRILDDKIRLADQENTPESRKAKWQMMRLRDKMERIATKEATRSRFVHPTSVQQ